LAARLLCTALLLALVTERATAADAFKPFKLKTLDGTERSLSDVLGKGDARGVLLPDLPVLQRGVPDVQRIYTTYKDQGLSMVWINVLTDEEKLIADWQRTPQLHGARVAGESCASHRATTCA
jgi:hypothetical protein